MTKKVIVLPDHPHTRTIAAILQFLDDEGFHQAKQALYSELTAQVSKPFHYNGRDHAMRGNMHIPIPEKPNVLLSAMALWNESCSRVENSPITSVKELIYNNRHADIPSDDPVTCLEHVHAANIVAICWHPSKSLKVIASGGSDGSVRVINVETQELIFRCSLPAPILSIASSCAFCDLLVIGCFDGSLHFVDIANGSKSCLAPSSCKRITCVKFSPNGLVLAAASADNTVGLFRCPNTRHPVIWKECHRLHLLSTPESVCWIGSRLVISVRGDHRLHYYDSEHTFSLTQRLNMNSNGDDYCSFNVLDLCTGNTELFHDICMASTDKNRAIMLNDRCNGPIFSFYGAINDEYSTPRTALSWNDSHFYSTSQDNTVVIWDLKTQRVQGKLETFAKLPRDLSVNSASGELAVCSYDRTIRIFDCVGLQATSRK